MLGNHIDLCVSQLLILIATAHGRYYFLKRIIKRLSVFSVIFFCLLLYDTVNSVLRLQWIEGRRNIRPRILFTRDYFHSLLQRLHMINSTFLESIEFCSESTIILINLRCCHRGGAEMHLSICSLLEVLMVQVEQIIMVLTIIIKEHSVFLHDARRIVSFQLIQQSISSDSKVTVTLRMLGVILGEPQEILDILRVRRHTVADFSKDICYLVFQVIPKTMLTMSIFCHSCNSLFDSISVIEWIVLQFLHDELFEVGVFRLIKIEINIIKEFVVVVVPEQFTHSFMTHDFVPYCFLSCVAVMYVWHIQHNFTCAFIVPSFYLFTIFKSCLCLGIGYLFDTLQHLDLAACSLCNLCNMLYHSRSILGN